MTLTETCKFLCATFIVWSSWPVHRRSNYYRRRPDHGVATCWGIYAAKDREPFCGFPVLQEEERVLVERVRWWNGKMEEKGVKRKVLGIARHEIRLTAM